MSAPVASVPTREHPVVGWLWTLCEGARPQIAAPWEVTIEGEVWTGATSGHVIAMTRGSFGFSSTVANIAGAIERASHANRFAFPMEAAWRLADPTPDPTALPACIKCDNTGLVECEDCEGEGTEECECDCGDLHEKPCYECKSKGEVPCECGRVANPKAIFRRCQIGVGVFDLNLLAKALRYLPRDVPAVWIHDQPERAAMLDVGEWRALFMPLRQFDETGIPDFTIEIRPLGGAP